MRLDILTVIGARPQFIKACILSEQIKKDSKVNEILVHTGQHYDENMSHIFFHQLNMPQPDYYLAVGSGTQGSQTGKMLIELEKVMTDVQPDLVLVYGDTNSTIAGSLAAAKLHIPVAHVEAGLRSFNKRMPEEINRIVTDHLSQWLFCPSEFAVQQLQKEGIQAGVYLTGDIMYDAVLRFKQVALQQSAILKTLSISKKNYYLLTVHRADNTDEPEQLKAILRAMKQLDSEVIFPLHPRTRQKINEYGLNNLLNSSPITIVEPLGYFDMLHLLAEAKAILTDSGGLQKEAYMLKVPCVTLRHETEWIETIQSGWNHLAGTQTKQIIHTVKQLEVPKLHPSIFGDGKAATKILSILKKSKEDIIASPSI